MWAPVRAPSTRRVTFLLLALLLPRRSRVTAAGAAGEGGSCKSKPRCTSVQNHGTFNGETFVPSANCYEAVFSRDDTRQALAGRWIHWLGGSNAQVTFAALASMLAPDNPARPLPIHPPRPQPRPGPTRAREPRDRDSAPRPARLT